ncbi:MAG: hypothetical protein NWQ09_13145, partial [Nonlabens sp.]|nr:hypothetical protein [Nonlabens sp.]
DITDKKSGYLYYQNGTYFYVTQNGETKIFNRGGVQVHEMNAVIISGSVIRGKTVINDKSFSFTIDKNGALEFKDSSGNVVTENLLTVDETFKKSQNIVLPASSDKLLSLDSNTKPLFVIDGKIQDIKTGEPKYLETDVVSVNVLKGNDATNKYGDAGKNGVVEITTKKEVNELKYLFPKKQTSNNSKTISQNVVITTLESTMSDEEVATIIREINNITLDDVLLKKVVIANNHIIEMEIIVQDGVTEPKNFIFKNATKIPPVLLTVTNGMIEISTK